MGNLHVLEHRVIHADPTRDLHGPCAVQAANGDWLLCHQDSDGHHGGDGFVHQWRSRDSGATWEDEGPAADWRGRGLDSLFGEYGLAPNGHLVMFVQRREPRSGNEGMHAAWYAISADHGATWVERGAVDASADHAVLYARNVITWEQKLMVACWSLFGHGLYVSTDHGESWQRRSVVFPPDYPGFGAMRTFGPPYYPNIVRCPDDSLLAICYVTPHVGHCFLRRSQDRGYTWAQTEPRPDLRVWAPRLKRMGEGVLLLTGRDTQRRATIACFSTDNGKSWSEPFVVDQPAHKGSYGYTDTLPLQDGTCWIFASSPQSPGRGDIVSVRVALE